MVNINARGHQQWTAIFFAASNRHVSMTKTLLKHPDLNLNLINDQGRTPLWWAEHGQHSSVVDLLRKHSRSRKRKRRLPRVEVRKPGGPNFKLKLTSALD
ncbi:hypothetical protein N7490_000030 [Penicillium lividum]|nr:hypothetical protein N7490_000030 [Penicillium lividum]